MIPAHLEPHCRSCTCFVEGRGVDPSAPGYQLVLWADEILEAERIARMRATVAARREDTA